MQENRSLESKTITAMIWSFSDLIANYIVQFIIQIFLARLIMPKDFGMIGMITVFIALSQSLVDFGFSNALIREKEVSQEDFSTVFFVNIGIACTVYIILFFSAHGISRFFNEPQLVNILRVLALVIIIDCFGLIQRTMLVKNVNFKTQTRISVISSVFSGMVAIVLAYLGYGVWSLVVRALTMETMYLLLLWLSNKWFPSLIFKRDSLKRLFGFAWKLLVSGLIDTLYNNLYYVIIGRKFSAVELGYYTNAQKLRDTASQSITASVQKVSYPVFSKMQGDNERLKLGYKKIIKNVVFITFPVMIGLAAVANQLIYLLFGVNWIQSIPYFQVLCFAGMLFPLHAINLNILQVKGRSDLFLKLEIVKKTIGILSIGFVLLCKLGIWGLIWTAVMNSFIAYFINSYFSAELLSYSTKEQLKDIIPTLIVSTIMGVIVYASGMVFIHNDLIKLLVQVMVGGIAYIGLSKVAKIEELNSVFNILKVVLKRRV